MEQLPIRDIQHAELKMLKSIVKIFNKYSIKYYLSGGSVLGAVRHQGFIPWDDDVDIMVPRIEYDKLQEIFDKELPDTLLFQNHINCKEFLYVFSRVTLKNSALVYRGVDHLPFHHGLHIDIQPIDKVPEGRKLNILIHKMKLCKILLIVRYMNDYRKGKKRSFLKRLIIHTVALLISKEKTHMICENTMRKYQNSNVTGVACLGGIYGLKEGFPESVLGKGVSMKFEDTAFIVPEKYDYYLKQLYGDYMTPLPENERYNHHDIHFFSLTEEYDRSKHDNF